MEYDIYFDESGDLGWMLNQYFIWRHYEDNNSGAYHVLKPWLAEHLLLFEIQYQKRLICWKSQNSGNSLL